MVTSSLVQWRLFCQWVAPNGLERHRAPASQHGHPPSRAISFPAPRHTGYNHAVKEVFPMGKIESYVPGSFCWAELATSDAESAKKFYTRMFGWTTMELPSPGGVYTIFQ